MNSIDQLAMVLEEKKSVMEQLKLILKDEQKSICELDLDHLAATGQNKERVLAQLQVLNEECREHLSKAGTRFSLPPDTTLSPLIAVVGSPARELLEKLQKSITTVATEVELLNSTTRQLLQDSLRVTNRSLEFFQRFLGGPQTYGASGQLMEGSAKPRILCKEI